MIQEQTIIIERAFDLNQMIIKMSYKQMYDFAKLQREHIDAMKGGKNKGWYTAIGLAITLIFVLVWNLFKMWLSSQFGYPFV